MSVLPLTRWTIQFFLTASLFPLAWLVNPWNGCAHSVVVGSSRSCWVPALFGVPQGSVLGPLLYTADISSLMRSCGLLHQLYADDIQAYMYILCNAADAVASVGLMCSAIDAFSIGGWPQIVCFWIYPKPSLFGLVDVDSWPKLTCIGRCCFCKETRFQVTAFDELQWYRVQQSNAITICHCLPVSINHLYWGKDHEY